MLANTKNGISRFTSDIISRIVSSPRYLEHTVALNGHAKYIFLCPCCGAHLLSRTPNNDLGVRTYLSRFPNMIIWGPTYNLGLPHHNLGTLDNCVNCMGTLTWLCGLPISGAPSDLHGAPQLLSRGPQLRKFGLHVPWRDTQNIFPHLGRQLISRTPQHYVEVPSLFIWGPEYKYLGVHTYYPIVIKSPRYTGGDFLCFCTGSYAAAAAAGRRFLSTR